MSTTGQGGLSWAGVVAGLIPYYAARPWYKRVESIVPGPYLDEVFHIPQAQAFCAGNYTQWDSKITTPPGLYIISIAFSWVSSCCSTTCLRFHNTLLLCLVARTSRDVLRLLNRTRSASVSSEALDWIDVHTAINIALFPCLFFFSALYYTDIASALSVLFFYQAFLVRRNTILSGLWQVSLALISLSMRQTNIFWVAIFPAGLTLVTEARRTPLLQSRAQGLAKLREVFDGAWTVGRLFDPHIDEAGAEDYLLMTLSLAVISIRNINRVITALLPYLLILLLFAAFVVWNGGVVLGDKSNHVATIHLPQMLYIWPYVAFFSFPLMMPTVLRLLSDIMQTFTGSKLSNQSSMPRLVLIASFSALAAVIIYFNTIVHPFTLADNRHYTFYVFRLLLRNDLTKYGASLLYIGSAWLSIQTLGNSGYHVSFVLIWLIASALSLITAPLVEPRYFIMPWLIWRLNISSRSQGLVSLTSARQNGDSNQKPAGHSWLSVLSRHHQWLWLETAWSMIVNLVTGYMFLYRGFAWPQEPGNVQRFMW